MEAYKEILAPKKEVVHGEVEKPLKEEKKEEEEMIHPEAKKEEEMIHPEAAEAVQKVEKPEKLELEEKAAKKGEKRKKKADGGIPTRVSLRSRRGVPLSRSLKKGKRRPTIARRNKTAKKGNEHKTVREKKTAKKGKRPRSKGKRR